MACGRGTARASSRKNDADKSVTKTADKAAPGRKRRPAKEEAEKDEEGSSNDENTARQNAAKKRGRPANAKADASPGKKAKPAKVVEAEGYDSLDAASVKAIEKMKDKLNELKAQTLKDMLRRNSQPFTAKKEVLVTRVAEGRVLGAIPKCPSCKVGNLAWNPSSGEYACKGSFQQGEMQKCPFKATEVERSTWIKDDDEEVSSDSAEEAGSEEDAESETSSTAKDAKAEEEVKPAAKKETKPAAKDAKEAKDAKDAKPAAAAAKPADAKADEAKDEEGSSAEEDEEEGSSQGEDGSSEAGDQ